MTTRAAAGLADMSSATAEDADATQEASDMEAEVSAGPNYALIDATEVSNAPASDQDVTTSCSLVTTETSTVTT